GPGGVRVGARRAGPHGAGGLRHRHGEGHGRGPRRRFPGGPARRPGPGRPVSRAPRGYAAGVGYLWSLVVVAVGLVGLGMLARTLRGPARRFGLVSSAMRETMTDRLGMLKARQ